MSKLITQGSTDQSTVIRFVDSGDGTPENGVTSATGGLSLSYRREGGLLVAISPSDLSALDDAHVDGGLLLIGNGYYRLDLPDAAVAAGATDVIVTGTATGMVVIGASHSLLAADLYDAVSAGLSRLDAPISNVETDTQDIQSRLPAALTGDGNIKSDALAVSGDATAADNLEAMLDGTGGVTLSATLSDLESIVADSIPADGTRPSVKQALYMITQFLMERAVSGATVTVNKPDGSALLTLTLNDASSPTSITRAT